MKEDMTNLHESLEGEEVLNYFTSYGFDVDTYEYENCRNYLGSNGLFINRIPPEIIEKTIEY